MPARRTPGRAVKGGTRGAKGPRGNSQAQGPAVAWSGSGNTPTLVFENYTIPDDYDLMVTDFTNPFKPYLFILQQVAFRHDRRRLPKQRRRLGRLSLGRQWRRMAFPISGSRPALRRFLDRHEILGQFVQ